MKGCTTVILAFFLLFTGSGCKQEPQSTGPKYGLSPSAQAVPGYHFAIHPLHNPAKLVQEYQPLIDYLNARLKGKRLILEASRDYATFEEKYRARQPEFLLPNPWQTIQAMQVGYGVIAMAGEAADFKGIFIVRKDSSVREPVDLKGKAVSYPSATALAACVMPQYFLHTHGLNVNKDIENRYVGSQESSIMNVYLQKTVAGATWPPPWRGFQKEHPEEAKALTVRWETEPLINNSVMVRNDIPADFREQVQTYLLELPGSEQGKAILVGMETARFLPATDKDYEVVHSFVERFEREVREVEVP
ncbi:MAG: PhnD/SsuA/transferrin family substrate-binding protein [Desulfobulbaceae bacterium]|nr:PhnD/SsuA/transferrin family substrate-binding protein [Desulfobulbaceae bacterium]